MCKVSKPHFDSAATLNITYVYHMTSKKHTLAIVAGSTTAWRNLKKMLSLRLSAAVIGTKSDFFWDAPTYPEKDINRFNQFQQKWMTVRVLAVKKNQRRLPTNTRSLGITHPPECEWGWHLPRQNSDELVVEAEEV